MEVATWLFMLALAYGIGVFWYDLLPGKLPDLPWRVAAYPFTVMVLAEAFLPLGPTFQGFHPGGAVIAALIGCIVDWLITRFRHPEAIETPELRRAPAHS
jgi:hypothetical protein